MDFGDDMGEVLIRAIGDAAGRAAYHYIDDRAKSWHAKRLQDAGMAGEDLEAQAAALAERPQVCIPFGTAQDALTYAEVCSDAGVWAQAFEGPDGRGYLAFAEADLSLVTACAPQYASMLTDQNLKVIVDRLTQASPISEEARSALHPVSVKTEASVATPARPEAEINHTEHIRDKVASARDRCVDYKDFERLLAKDSIGITVDNAGQTMFYEARIAPDGSLLPFTRADGHGHDWAVGSQTLKTRWGIDATETWFSENRPPADGAMDTDGRTQDATQGIASHDTMDTDTRTARIEREGVGSDVAPSHAKKDDTAPDLSTVAEESRAASAQLSKGRNSPVRDLSDKFQPSR